MKANSLLIIVLEGLLLAPLVGGTSFSYNNDMKCSDPAHVTISSLDCGGSDCNFGDLISAYGVLTVSSEMPETSCIVAKTCIMGINIDWLCQTAEDKVEMCDYLDLMSDNSECPSAGSYAFQQSFNIPSFDRSSLGAGWWVTTKISVSDCYSGSSYTQCSLSFNAVASSSTTYSFLNMSAVGIAAVAVIAYAVRKRRVARIDLQHEEQLVSEGQATSGFAQMRDIGVRV